MTASEPTVLMERDGHVAIVTLNRPERLNALNGQIHDEFEATLGQLNNDADVRCVVITGSGRAFCAGADMKELAPLFEDRDWEDSPEHHRQALRQGGQRIMHAVRRMDVPTIAMVNGVAVGGGFDLVATCDMAVGSENARFMVAYVRRGLFPDLGGFWVLPRIVGPRKAIQIITTADFVEADEAKELGILNELVPHERLREETLALAQRIAANPPIAVRLSKMLMWRGLQLDYDTAMEWSASTTALTEMSEDHHESVRAFLEKRDAKFEGR